MPIGRIVEQNIIGLEVYDGTADGTGTTRVVAVKPTARRWSIAPCLKAACHRSHRRSPGLRDEFQRPGRTVGARRFARYGHAAGSCRVQSLTRDEAPVKVRATAASIGQDNSGNSETESMLDGTPTPLIPTEPLPTINYLSGRARQGRRRAECLRHPDRIGPISLQRRHRPQLLHSERWPMTW